MAHCAPPHRGVVVLLVAYTISLQARRTVSVGSLGTYGGNGLGPWAGVAAGWALLIGYLGFAAIGLLGAVLYVKHFLEKLGLAPANTGWKVLLLVIVTAPAILVPFRGLRLSARLELGLELVSLTAIGIIFVATWIDHGFAFDAPVPRRRRRRASWCWGRARGRRLRRVRELASSASRRATPTAPSRA